MKKASELFVVLLFVLATAGVVAALLLYEQHKAGQRNTIELEARPVSTWSRTEIVVRKGEHVRIRVRNVDNVSHGFAIPELDVAERIIRAGQNEIVEFVPQHAGEFVYKCVVQCSRDRSEFMVGKLIVKE